MVITVAKSRKTNAMIKSFMAVNSLRQYLVHVQRQLVIRVLSEPYSVRIYLYVYFEAHLKLQGENGVYRYLKSSLRPLINEGSCLVSA